MDPVAQPLSFFGSQSECPLVEWSWVDSELQRAGVYWIVPKSLAEPHPRPVWGVWHDGQLLLSIGSPVIARQLDADPVATVHLQSGTDVVIVECRRIGSCADPDVLSVYDAKYEWNYTVDEYGPLTVLQPTMILAWRSGGVAGRAGFQAAGRWGPAVLDR